MKKLLFNLTFIFSFINCNSTLFGQISPVLVNTSYLIVEGKIIEQRCIEPFDNGDIYTLSTLKVYKKLKGNFKNQTINFLTFGGQIGNKQQTFSHGFVASKEMCGLFFLNKSNLISEEYFLLNNDSKGFLQYIDYKTSPKAYGLNLDRTNIPNTVYKIIEDFTGEKLHSFTKTDYEVSNSLESRNAPCVEYRLINPSLTKVISITSTDVQGFMLNFDIEIRNEEEFDYQKTEFSMEYSKDIFGEYIVNQKDINIKLSDELSGYSFQLNDETSTKWHLSINKLVSSSPLKVNNFYQKLFSASLFLKSNDLSKILELKVDESKDLMTYKIENGISKQISCSFFNKNINAPITNFVAPNITKLNGLTTVPKITAGTRTLLTIEGTNFLTSPTSTIKPEVWFTNAYRDALPIEWMKPNEEDYKSRTMTKIEVYVPTVGTQAEFGFVGLGGYYAGTGDIKVYRPADKLFSNNKSITVRYAAINNEKPNLEGQPIFLSKQNENGGYIIAYTGNFKKKTDKNSLLFSIAFERALKNWQCKTGLNFIVDATIDPEKNSNYDILVDIDKSLPVGGAYAVTGFSSYIQNGCDISINNGSKNHPELTNVDFFQKGKILFNDNYTTWNADVDQLVERVTLHELGHAHGLYHVKSASELMYPGVPLSNKITVEAENASNYIIEHSSIKNTCKTYIFKKHSCKTPIIDFENELDIELLITEKNIFIKNKSLINIKNVTIYDIKGSIVATNKIDSNDDEVILPNSVFSNGCYFLLINTDLGNKILKFVNTNK